MWLGTEIVRVCPCPVSINPDIYLMKVYYHTYKKLIEDMQEIKQIKIGTALIIITLHCKLKKLLFQFFL